MKPARRFVLRQLPFSARLTLAVFLLTVGLGYGSALIQLHLQHATGNNILPSNDDVVRFFHGATGPAKSHIQRLVEADESLPFNGSGSMARAFTTKSDEWAATIKERANEQSISIAEAEVALRKERDGERQVVLAWLASGPSKEDYENDRFSLPEHLANNPLTKDYRIDHAARVKTILTDRCARCHFPDGEASNYPLENFEQIQKYTKLEANPGRVSLEKLTQSTHAHLLSFAVLFAFTGVLFALTNYPALLRLVLAPLVLLAQVADIGCWWLARLDGSLGEQFALAIPITGAIVGGGLALQIVLTLFHLFGFFGRIVLLILFGAAAYTGNVAREKYVVPYLQTKAEMVKKS